MRDLMGEHCVLCGAGAAVRVAGTSFCASCGLEQYSNGSIGDVAKPRRKRRAALLSLLSSGFLAKMLLGAVAVAAVGGVAVSTVANDSPSTVQAQETYAVAEVTETTVPTTTLETATTAVAEVAAPTTSSTTSSAAPRAAAAHEYAAAIQDWADCISTAASEHSGGPFDPKLVGCEKPRPHTFGLGPADPPGHDEDGPGNSENAPGQSEDGPGNSENAPGQSEDGPGNSQNAPGQDEDGPGNSENAPGQVDKDKDTEG